MLWALVRRFKWRVSATVSLVLAEACIDLLFPLFIGIAINGLLADSFAGLVALAALGVAALVVGSARRLLDTRAYTGIYEQIAVETVQRQRLTGAPTSAIAARTNLLGEFVEFLEDSLPQLVASIVSVVGILAIIAALDISVFWCCLALLALVAVTYTVTSPMNYRYNSRYNDELETQVDKITNTRAGVIEGHFKSLMRWNRKLSDLETLNYGVIWIGVIALLIYAPVAIIEPGETEYGFAFSAVVYVFQYIEAIAVLPLFVQQLVRLREISTRLRQVDPQSKPDAGPVSRRRPPPHGLRRGSGP